MADSAVGGPVSQVTGVADLSKAAVSKLTPPTWLALESGKLCKVCAGCQMKHATSFCGKCSVTPYCSVECQRSHWKSFHKATCIPIAPATPPVPTAPSAAPPGAGDDFDTPYAALLLKSGGPYKTMSEMAGAIQGLTHFDPRQQAANAARFGWAGQADKVVHGYCHEDIHVMRLWFDVDQEQNGAPRPPVARNMTANLIMQNMPFGPGTNLLGDVVVGFGPRWGTNSMEVGGDDESDPEHAMPGHTVTRHDAYDLLNYRFACSVAGTVPGRIHRENMRRYEQTAQLQSMGYRVVSA
jgi:hypothetical protein